MVIATLPRASGSGGEARMAMARRIMRARGLRESGQPLAQYRPSAVRCYPSGSRARPSCMDNPNPTATDAIRKGVEASWHRFLDVCEPLRPELYRYCRHLTRSPWDADDLVQDALFRAFAKLGWMNEAPHNPRAWLFRIASNLWMDRVRAIRPEPEADMERASSREPREIREAAGTLLSRLSPQERAAV